MANKEDKVGNQPDYIVSTPVKRGEKTFWQRIGAAWIKNEGISIQLNALPCEGGNLFLAKPDKEEKK